MNIRKLLQHLKFISSNDVDIVASERKTQELFDEADATGKAPGNSCKIQILGDERVGKTSLRKKLMGEKFDPNEPPTFGIDTRMCKVNEIDESWRERKDETISEYDRIMSWVIANGLQKWRNETSETTNSWVFRILITTIIAIVSLLLVSGLVILALVLSLIITGSTSSYGLVLVSVSSVFITRKSDIYRVVVGLAILVPLIHALLAHVFDHQATNNLSNRALHIDTLTTITWLTSGMLFGFVCGIGLRTGVAAGFLLVTTPIPQAEYSLWTNQSFFVVATYTTVVLGINIGMVLAIGSQYILPYILPKTSVGTKVPNWLLNFSVIPTGILAAAFTIDMEWTTQFINYCMCGILMGFGITTGLLCGRWSAANISPSRSVDIFFITSGLLTGLVTSYLCGYRIPYLHEDGLGIVGAIQRILPLVCVEIYRRFVSRNNPAPVQMVSKTLVKDTNTLPTKLSLWDFAGQEFYYNNHHTFMAPDAVYLIVFDLSTFKQLKSRTSEFERIKYWMKSVYQHADSSIILVGTHLDSVNHRDLAETSTFLDSMIFSHYYSFLSKLVFNGASPFFAVDNSGTLSESSDLEDDTTILRDTIRKEAQRTRPMTKEYPIRWRRFLDLIHSKQRMSSPRNTPQSALCGPFVSLPDLMNAVEGFGFSDMKEMKDMLEFFHDSGEILYDSVDSILRQFVVLQPQLLVDVMQSIVVLPEATEIGSLSWAGKLLQRTGVLEYELLKLLITRMMPSISNSNLGIVLGMLEAKDLICKVTRLEENSEHHREHREGKCGAEVYVVPSMLPVGQPVPPVDVAWNRNYYIDFGAVLPDAVLFRLMVRCASHSDLVSHSADQCMLFREGGLFTLGTQFFFMLRKLQPNPNQYIIEVSVKAVPESNPLDVLRYLSNIIETLRCRDFPRLRYHVGIVCPHSMPHQSCERKDMWHIIRLCGNGDTSFPEESSIHRLCNGREIEISMDESIPTSKEVPDNEHIVVNVQGDNNFVVAGGRNARISIHRGISPGISKSSDNSAGCSSDTFQDYTVIDVYISSSPRDEGWLQEHLVRFLSGPPHELNVCVNRYDRPSNRNRVLNICQIEVSQVFLAICSKNYIRDPTGRLQYEREVARRRKMPLVAVIKDNTTKPKDMFDSEVISCTNTEEILQDSVLLKVVNIFNVPSD